MYFIVHAAFVRIKLMMMISASNLWNRRHFRVLKEIGVVGHDGDVRFLTESGNMAVLRMRNEKCAIYNPYLWPNWRNYRVLSRKFHVLWIGSTNTMVTSDLRAEVAIWPFRACTMHPAIIGTVRSLWTWLWGRYHVPQNVFLVWFAFFNISTMLKFKYCYNKCVKRFLVTRSMTVLLQFLWIWNCRQLIQYYIIIKPCLKSVGKITVTLLCL